MNKFLTLIEEFDPKNTSDPKWKLIDFLKSKGINVSLVRDTDMVYIDTGEDTIAVNVSQPEEEAESINASTGTYEVDKEVESLGSKANSGLTGLAAKAGEHPPKKLKLLSNKDSKLRDKQLMLIIKELIGSKKVFKP